MSKRNKPPGLSPKPSSSSPLEPARSPDEALRKSEQRFAAFMDNLQGFAWLKDTAGFYVYVNQNLEALLSPDWQGKSDSDYWPDEFATRYRKNDEAVVASRQPLQTVEPYLLGQTQRHLLVNKFPIYDADGKVKMIGGIGIDITAYLNSEEALHRVEQKYRDILDNVQEGIFQTTPEGRCITANLALARMLGFESPEQLIETRQNIGNEAYVDPHRREVFKSLLEQHGLVRNFEFEAFKKDGSRIWMSDNVRAVRDDDGRLLFYEGTVEDISERKRAESRRAIFSALARELSGAVTQNEAALIIAEAAANLFGWDSCNLDAYDRGRDLVSPLLNVDTIDGKKSDVTALISESGPTARSRTVIEQGRQLILREEPVQFDQESIPFGDQSRPSASIMSVPVRHGFEVIGLLSIQSYAPRAYDAQALEDFQALADYCGEAMNRIRTEQSLLESEERYRELFENSKDALYVHDLNGKYTSVNGAAEKLSGYSREEIIGKSFVDFVCPESIPRVRAMLGEKPKQPRETTYEVEIITKEGQRIPVEVSSRLIRKDNIPVAIEGSVRDITEIKKAKEASRTYSRRLIEAQERERRRISLELHDQIGQILTAVKINLYALQRRCDSPETRESIDDNLKVIDEAFAQVRNLSVDLRPLLLDDFGLVVALRWYLARQTNNSDVAAEFVSHNLDDEDRFSSEVETACFRIVQEAVTNVIRHAAATSIFVSIMRNQDELKLLIKDDGVGFDPQALRSASGSTTLGLRGMEERIQALRGSLSIKSQPGKGTRIRAFVPINSAPLANQEMLTNSSLTA